MPKLTCDFRKDCHDTVYKMDYVTGEKRVLGADPHMTVYMGSSFHNCQVQGHIYLVKNGGGIPVAVATPSQRVIVEEGKEREGVELWDMVGHGGGPSNKPRSPPRYAQWKDVGEGTRLGKGTYTPTNPQTGRFQKMKTMMSASSWRRHDENQQLAVAPAAAPALTPAEYTSPFITVTRKKIKATAGQGMTTVRE
jgi:hypothetical protein